MQPSSLTADPVNLNSDLIIPSLTIWLPVISNLQSRKQDLLLPAHKAEAGEEYAGATVIEPSKGLESISL